MKEDFWCAYFSAEWNGWGYREVSIYLMGFEESARGWPNNIAHAFTSKFIFEQQDLAEHIEIIAPWFVSYRQIFYYALVSQIEFHQQRVIIMHKK